MAIRLIKVSREFNIGVSTIVEFLEKKGHTIDSDPNTKLSDELYDLLEKEFKGESIDKTKKAPAKLTKNQIIEDEDDDESDEDDFEDDEISTIHQKSHINVKVIGKIDLAALNQKTRPDKKTKKEKEQERKERREKFKPAVTKPEISERTEKQAQPQKELIYKASVDEVKSPKVVGKVDLPHDDKDDADGNRKKRKRINKGKVDITAKEVFDAYDKKTERPTSGIGKKQQHHGKKYGIREEVNEEDVDKAIKETRARMDGGKKNKGAKYRRDKRDAIREAAAEEEEMKALEEKILKVTEFVSANDLSIMMNIPATDIIKTCMDVGLFIALNQRLDAETIQLIAGEFGFEVQFVTADIQESIEEVEDAPEDLVPRPPIVTVMGHVDHGKTSLLDYVRKSNVIAGEAGGITQHIGAYSVKLANGKRITFLDTPGHEAFTAMRARGAQVTDVVIIVVAADDCVMPQTVEAINHAAAAGVPIIFAINKIDKPGANPEKIKEQLAAMNYLVEDWGGKYQSQEIAAKHGVNVEELMEKVLLEAEMLDLKANPNKPALGTVIESQLDKGRGYISTLLVTAGTLRKGDIILAGKYSGKVKAMFNERNQQIAEAGPSTPITILGLDGAPQAGEKFNVMKSERDAREIANKRDQLHREQELKTMRHITLDEIGRRIAIGNFKELNIIIKGDVDGSIEALSDSLIKLSTEEIQINIKHKAVGQISEADVLLASASDAIIIGFQVRPSQAARILAEREGVDLRLYSIIYDAINEIKDAMVGMLSPEFKEEVTGSCEIREVFKITKVGTVAGCFVIEGKIYRNSKVRIIRDGIVVYTGELGSLKRFKEDVKEVGRGYECGLNIANYNDIKIGDIIEAYEEKAVKRKLE
ncbi:MAG: translation initiation factor IF-2 [Bacteroidales bacterium]|jgi:translation initiation factor IF-2|nr:translation initiation factor IF-2 [Bacteroidales bacterium]